MGDFSKSSVWAFLILVSGLSTLTLLLLRRRKHQKFRLQFTHFGNEFHYPKTKSFDMAVVFKSNQEGTFQVAPISGRGRPAKVQAGSVEYENPNPDAITVTENPDDETQFTVRSAAGEITESISVDVKVKADADLGDGVKTIEGILTVVVEPDSAEGFGINTLVEPHDVVEPTP